MEASDKHIYRTPSTMLVEVKQEGILCQSGGPYPQWEGETI